LPTEAHDTELTWAWLPLLMAAMPGTFSALPQAPFVSLTTKA
jgi:hypothetical protein